MSVIAPIVDIQRFSIHDGPGIRSLVFLKGCNLHCAWCQNPEAQERNPVIAFYQDRCHQCFACHDVCEEDAIVVNGFRVDYERCTVCGDCVTACPYGALRLIGETLTPEELLDKVLADLPYYESSGGGVTFTGGEPTLHLEFLDRVLDLFRQHNIHTNMQTAGAFSFDKCQHLLRKLDLIYFDLKILDQELHRRHIGGAFQSIIENARHLAEERFPVEFRIALIPGLTDTEQNIDRVIELLDRFANKGIHLLEYHNMGEVKIDIIQGHQPRLGLKRYSEDRLKEVRQVFESRGIAVLNGE